MNKDTLSIDKKYRLIRLTDTLFKEGKSDSEIKKILLEAGFAPQSPAAPQQTLAGQPQQQQPQQQQPQQQQPQQQQPQQAQQPKAQQSAELCAACNNQTVPNKNFCTKCGFITNAGWSNPKVRKNFAVTFKQYQHQAEGQQQNQGPDAVADQAKQQFMQNVQNKFAQKLTSRQ